MNNIRDLIEETIKDLVTEFLFAAREKDKILPLGVIEEAVNDGEISIEEMVDIFESELENNLT